MKHIGFAFVALISICSADSVSFPNFFSAEKFKGGVTCSAISPDGYLNEPTIVYLQPSIASKQSESVKLQASCAQGGGDCLCYALFLDKKDLSDTQAFYQVKTADSKNVWVFADKSAEKSIFDLATETKGGEIEFRKPIPDIFANAALDKKITKDELFRLPPEIEAKIEKKNTIRLFLFTVKSTDTINGNKVSNLSLDFVAYNLESPEDEKRQRFHLREVWIQPFDSEGRINFWLAEPPGC